MILVGADPERSGKNAITRRWVEQCLP